MTTQDKQSWRVKFATENVSSGELCHTFTFHQLPHLKRMTKESISFNWLTDWLTDGLLSFILCGSVKRPVSYFHRTAISERNQVIKLMPWALCRAFTILAWTVLALLKVFATNTEPVQTTRLLGSDWLLNLNTLVLISAILTTETSTFK